MRPHLVACFAWIGSFGAAAGADDRPTLPKVASGWSIEVVASSPAILYPTASVVAPDGTAYVGQDPMDMPGPATSRIDSVVAVRGGRVAPFAEGLGPVMGLEFLDGALFVVHAPFLSSFRDTDGDGRADRRVDLVMGLGPAVPGFNGINDHIASGIRLGIDGFLYVAVGDKGIARGVGRDGRAIAMSTGGVIRVRPDGSGLEVVSTGERNPLSVALSSLDDVFSLGNDDDSHRWPNSLTHHVVGGHYGYPFEFLAHPDRALPIVSGRFGGAGTQGLAITEAGLPPRFRGNLIFCDWGAQSVDRFELAPDGGSFALKSREPIVEKGDLADFRPFSIAAEAGGSSFLLVDWAFNGWLASGPRTGRLFRLSYTGPDRPIPPVRPAGRDVPGRIAALGHPALSVRSEAQRALARLGRDAVAPLAATLASPGAGPARVHAIWALDAIATPEAARAIDAALGDGDPSIRAQAARSVGIRRAKASGGAVRPLLRDADPAVRREAAIALGRLGDRSAGLDLYAALGDPDRFVAWSVRRAIRDLGAWDPPLLAACLADPRRRDDGLRLADESWSVPAVRALNAALEAAGSADPAWRGRIVATLAGLYRRQPGWSGRWFGTNPLAGPMPASTVDWSPEGMDAVLAGLVRGSRDGDAAVRGAAIAGLVGVGPRALPPLRAGLASEPDEDNLAALIRGLGAAGDLASARLLAPILVDPKRPIGARLASLDALTRLDGPDSLRSRMAIVFDPAAPEALVARALPALGRGRALPSGDLVEFLYRKGDEVRASALESFPIDRPLAAGIRTEVVDRLVDPSPLVRKAALAAVERYRIREAIPRLLEVAGAEADGDRPEATRALASLPDPRGVAVYARALRDRDPELRRAGATALLAIRDEAGPELTALARQGRFVGPSALAVERILADFRPVVAWRGVGPFPRSGAADFPDSAAIDFRKAVAGVAGRPVSWRDLAAEPGTGRVGLGALLEGAGPRPDWGFEAGHPAELSAFAYAEVRSDRDRPALLLVEAAGAFALAVNDRPALNRPAGEARGTAGDPEVVRVALRQGTNRLLAWSRQGAAGWSFAVRVSEGSTLPLGGSIGLEGLRAFALGHGGDPRNGETLFFQADGIGCARCHAVGGRGGPAIGPDLAGLGSKYDKAEIIRSVLEPSARIAGDYRVEVVVRDDGTVASGLKRGEDAAHLDLVDASGRAVRIDKAKVEKRAAGEASLMPAGLVDGLSPVEFADLIAYLAGLRAR